MPSVRVISPSEHHDFLTSRASASFLQTPGWAAVKSEWRPESLGWFEGEEQVGAALVLHRKLPRLNKSLAYLPEGPVIDWTTDRLGDWLEPMVTHLKQQGAFAVRIGPPVVTARWDAQQVKAGIADDAVTRLTQLPPTEQDPAGARVVSQLTSLGWRRQDAGGGFSAGQPRYNFQIPLVSTGSTTGDGSTTGERSPRTEDDVLKGMNQQWRRNIKKATKAGVEVEQTDPRGGLKLFHDLYVHTAERDGFTPRPLSYFRAMFEALAEPRADAVTDLRLYLARHEGDLVAATIWIRVGEHSWYSYGASSTEKRDVRGSNAIQWRMITDALTEGAAIYDLRGITETLDADDPHVGLIQFKVGTGGEAVEYAGEWDLPINRALYKAFQIYLSRR
ncbi:aminoacyltransferase [Nocardioides panacisoli]|uniref:lipid II:glycine glycyltransferase FemX n=1 Tax=Nocardioides panacisoli TaxID=627624 RepID=UPI001C63B800|nr:peptidoglycan bridge formation glycyltransferase FemA/FemB family protein [Nocardioides panacisoli]QYJ03313.1 aminoacyltransferase [Nocardioides panacisoli]